jgi:DNA repair photolyase
VRDFDLLKQINEEAILPADLQQQLSHKVIITFSFSTLDHHVANIFEPGATLPGQRLDALQSAIHHGFVAGVSLMPLIPYISDTDEQLEIMFRTFSNMNVNHIFPASITLFGSGTADSKTLVMRAIRLHYPYLVNAYEKLFANGFQVPGHYRNELEKKQKR